MNEPSINRLQALLAELQDAAVNSTDSPIRRRILKNTSANPIVIDSDEEWKGELIAAADPVLDAIDEGRIRAEDEAARDALERLLTLVAQTISKRKVDETIKDSAL